MAFLKNELMYVKTTKKVKLINRDCLPILMPLYIMLCIMLAYLMLFVALSNSVCLYNAYFAIDFCKRFCFHVLSWFIHSYFVYFMYYFASCTVLLICWFFPILCSHRFLFFYERAMYSLKK